MDPGRRLALLVAAASLALGAAAALALEPILFGGWSAALSHASRAAAPLLAGGALLLALVGAALNARRGARSALAWAMLAAGAALGLLAWRALSPGHAEL